MKSRIVTRGDIQYPVKEGCIYESNGGRIVLATHVPSSTGFFSGVLIYSPFESEAKGKWDDSWAKIKFKLFTGLIEISN